MQGMDDDDPAERAPTDHLLRLAFERTPVGLAFVTVDREAVVTNPAMSDILGYSAEELRGLSIADLTHPEDRDVHEVVHRQLIEGKRDWYQVDKRYIHRDGHTVWAVLHVAAIHDDEGRVSLLVSQVHDITRRIEAHEIDRWRAMHDPLTGIGNRNLLMQDLAAHLDRYNDGAAPAPAVLIMDLDGFKSVNDECGHLVGDRLLTAVGRYLSANVSADATVGRLGGDEFMVVLSRCTNGTAALDVAERLRRGLCDVIRAELSDCRVSASIGVAVAPPTTIPELMRLADAALYEAKAAGKNAAVLA